MHNRYLFCTVLASVLVCESATAQGQWPTKSWPTSTPRAEGLDGKVLEKFDAEIAAGTFGNVDSMLVIRHGRIVFDRSYKHDYDRIYAQEAAEPGPLNANDPLVPTTTSIPGGIRFIVAATCTRCNGSPRRSRPS